MSNGVDVEKVQEVLRAHDWLIDALREADWWIHEDGSIRFQTEVEDHEDVAPGLAAFADALDCELRSGGETPPDPAGAPMRFEDLPR